MTQHSQQNEATDREMKTKRLIRKFGITQIVIAILCIILGIIGTVLNNTVLIRRPYYYGGYPSSRYYYYYNPSTGSGIWSSIFTVIAGGIGIGIGSPSSGKGLMIAHMVLAIIGCVSEMIGIIISSIVSTSAYYNAGSISFIYIILCILSVINFSFLITTSAFCCKLLACCCGSATNSGHQVTYVPQTTVQAPHGMMMQQPQGTVMMQQPQGTVMMQQPAGAIMTQQPQGTVMMQQPAGAIMVQQPQGTVMMQQPQGTVMTQQPQGFPPQYYQPPTNSHNTGNLINSEGFVQPQETKVAPPSYS